VLDDYHTIQRLSVHQQLAFLLKHQLAQMHIVIATREDPPVPLAQGRRSTATEADDPLGDRRRSGRAVRPPGQAARPGPVTSIGQSGQQLRFIGALKARAGGERRDEHRTVLRNGRRTGLATSGR
jgi:hypothetical protein